MSYLDELYISAQIRKGHLMDRIKDRIMNEEGSVVETIIIVAVFAALTVFAVNLISNAVRGKAQDAANVIESASFN